MLDAAVAVLRRPDRRDGTLSVEEVAAELGVTRPVLYRYFGDRQGLALAVGQRFAAEVMDAIAVALAEPADDPRDLLVGTIDAYLRVVEADANLYRYVFSEASAAAAEQRGFVHEVAGRIASVVGERLRELGRDSGAAEPWAYALVGMTHQAGDWWLDRRSMPRARLVEYLVALAWDGLAAVATPVPGRPQQRR